MTGHQAESGGSLAELAERIAYTFAETVDNEWGCCHSTDDLRAGGRPPESTHDKFEPLPETCQGRRVLNEWLPQIAALALPPKGGAA